MSSSSSSIISTVTIPVWYTEFEHNLRNTYTNVKSYTGNLVLSGSSAIAYLLKELNMITELNLMNDHPPKDFDFMYNEKDISYPNIVGFKKSTTELVDSITYNKQNTTSKYNSFDLIYYPNRTPIKYITINNIDILCPNRLLMIYQDKVSGWYGGERNEEFDTKRLKLLEQIINKNPQISTNCITYTQTTENNENNNSNLNRVSNPFNSNMFDSPPSSPVKKQKLNNTTQNYNSPPSTPRGGSYYDKYQKYKNKYIKLRNNLK